MRHTVTVLLAAAAAALSAMPVLAQEAASDAVPAAEQPVDPYPMADANADAPPFAGDAMFQAFHGKEGISRIVDDLVARSVADPRIADIFKATDLVRLRRTLKEQICYILGGGCAYSGRDMKLAHKDQGLTYSDFGALVENLQAAMTKEGVPSRVQNRLIARLAPMRPSVVER